MKFCFIAEDPNQVNSVYPPYVKQNMQEKFNQSEAPCYNKEYVLAHPQEFAEVEYIFSTWSMPRFEIEEIKQCFPKLRALMYGAGSVQAFARPFLNCEVDVFSAWGVNAIPVAEMATSLILLSNKGYLRACRCLSQDASQGAKALDFLWANRGNYGCKVGVLGIGMVGSEVCRMLARHKLTILAYDPFCSPQKAEALGITLTSLEQIFSECEVISIHISDNPNTRGMLNYDLFKLMHDNATFINTGRGAQVVESDLARALKEKPFRSAVLDVTSTDPATTDASLYSMENVFLSPHIAGSQQDEWWRMAECMLEEAISHREGKTTRYSVTEKMLETMA